MSKCDHDKCTCDDDGTFDKIRRLVQGRQGDQEAKEPKSYEAIWRQILLDNEPAFGMLAFYNLEPPPMQKEEFDKAVTRAQSMAKEEMNDGGAEV